MFRHLRIGQFAAVAALLALLLPAAPARAANWFEMNGWLTGPRYDSNLPGCDSTLALWEIQRKFSQKEGRFWNSSLSILEIDEIHETALNPTTANTIPRRFCTGIAAVSDGVRRPVHYVIEEGLGEIGAMWGVTWCVVGIDRNWAYNPACRAARP